MFEHAVFHPGEAPEQRVILYSPLPDHETPTKLMRLMEASGHPEPVAA
jgi:hypothetical protein